MEPISVDDGTLSLAGDSSGVFTGTGHAAGFCFSSRLLGAFGAGTGLMSSFNCFDIVLTEREVELRFFSSSSSLSVLCLSILSVVTHHSVPRAE